MRVLMETKFVGPEPACGTSMAIAKKAVRDWTVRDHRRQCDSLSGFKQAGALCQQNKGNVKTEQKPAMMGCKTAHRALLPKKTFTNRDW
jgi:hypothetical protein